MHDEQEEKPTPTKAIGKRLKTAFQNWKGWMALTPLSWIVVSLFPYEVGTFVDLEQVDWFAALVGVIWLTVIAFLVFRFRLKSLYVATSILVYILGVGESLHWLALDSPITVPSIHVFLESNFQESQAFFEGHFYWSEIIPLGALTLVGAVFLILGWRTNRHRINASRDTQTARPVWVYLMVFAAFVGFQTSKNKGFTAFPSTLYAFVTYHQEMSAYREVVAKQQAGEITVEATDKLEDQPRTLVVIVGESTNRHRMGAYGYALDTTPRMDRLSEEIVLFEDIISSHSHTRMSLQHALTWIDVENGGDFYATPSVIQAARAAGFETHWISNQVPFGMWDNAISAMGSTCNITQFVNFTGSSKQALTATSYDGKVLAPLKESLQSTAPKKLIFVHLMGAHGTYNRRYPSNFQYFEPAKLLSISAQIYAEYDNAVRYTDHIIGEIIELTRATVENEAKHPAALLYFSDHGEEVYDAMDYQGHAWTKITTNMMDIPFFVWMGTSWNTAFTEDQATLQAATSRAFMLDQLPHLLMDLLRIDIAHYQADRNLISPSYTPPTRMVHEHDYEEVRTKTKGLKSTLERSWRFQSYLDANADHVRAPKAP